MKSFPRSRAKRLIARLIFYPLIVFIVIPYILSTKITRPVIYSSAAREAVTDWPNLERFWIPSFDGTRLSCIRGTADNPRGTVIICHGFGDSKEGYFSNAQFLIANNFSAFLFDFPNHGQSGRRACTLGFNEKKDLLSVIGYVRNETGGEKIYLWGVSMGAATALLAAAEDGDIEGVIADCPFVSLDEIVERYFKIFLYLPRFPMVDLTLWMLKIRTGAASDDVDVLEAVKKLGETPVLFVTSENDRRIPPARVKFLYDNKAGEKAFWNIKGAGHAMGFTAANFEYREKALALLSGQ